MELTNSKQVTKSLIKFGMLFFVMVMFATSCDRGGGRNPVGPAPTKYTVTLNCNPTAGGTVTGAGTYNAGDTIFVTATANSGYQFVNWTHPNGSVAQTNTTARISAISEDWNLTANFQLTGSGSNQHTITLNRNPTAGGTVTGAGTFNAGTSRTVTATPNSGYTFSNWTESGNVVSTNSSYTFTLNSNRTLTANFQTGGGGSSYTVTLNRNPTAGGNVTGAGTYNAGTSVTVSASANTGYSFKNWTNASGSVVSSNSSYTFTINSNQTLTANFETQYTITLNRNPTAGGTVTGNGTFNAGTSRTVTATASSGYTFRNWTENGTVVWSNSSYSFNLNSNRTLTANFEAINAPSNVAGMRFKSNRFSWDDFTFGSNNRGDLGSAYAIALASAQKDLNNGVIGPAQFGSVSSEFTYTKTGSNTATLAGTCGTYTITLTFTTSNSGTHSTLNVTGSGNFGRVGFYLRSSITSGTFTLE